jgi:hypothetical protein
MRVAREDRPRPKYATAQHYEKKIPAPVKGWASNASIAKENPGYAEVLENFIPTTTGVRARGGSRLMASVGLLAVESLMIYKGLNGDVAFAAMNGSVFNVTSPVSPTSIVAAVFSGQTSNDYSHVNFSTAGGDFMLAFNGTDLHKIYNGTTWATNLPAITGVSTANISQAAVHANRIWMVQSNSKNAWYLPVDSIGGAASLFSLAGVFKKSTKLLYIATWSIDSGSGSSDRIAFISEEGEAVVYTGDYPSGSWTLFGIYETAKVLGKKSSQKIGGDLLVMTVNGIVPLSEAVRKDPAALSVASITRAIEPDWKEATAIKGDRSWSFLKWDQRNIGIVAIPSNTRTRIGSSVWGSFVWGRDPWGASYQIEEVIEPPISFVVNLQTGAWCKIIGWDIRSMAVFNGQFIFGTSNGKLVFGDVDGSDQGASYECKCAYWPSSFGYEGEKQFLQAACVFRNSTNFNPRVGISINNKLEWSAAPLPPMNNNQSAVWDSPTAIWDSPSTVWDQKGDKSVTYQPWISLDLNGRVGAVMLQMSFLNQTTPDVEFTDTLVTYERAAIVT